MTISRREVVLSGLASAALLAAGGVRAEGRLRRAPEPATKKRSILILGGTSFIGPAFIALAQARGHSVTVFNRGRTEGRKGHIDGIERLLGNRDPNLHAGSIFNAEGKEVDDPASPKGLESLKGRKFDAVLDTSGFYPRMVRASAELLRECGRYVFISTVSVYADNSKLGQDESAALATMPDPTVENMGPNLEYYGSLKALCEQEASKVFGPRATIIRPGYIVGPSDNSDRFTYWPVRYAEGGSMVAPGDGSDPIQIIDVRDLAEFCLTCIERDTAGVFNATGPAQKLTMRNVIEACGKAAPAAKTDVTWVASDFLEKQEAGAGVMPIWVPLGQGEYGGMHTWSIAAALAAGLKFRPTEDTCRDLIAWWPGEVERRARVAKDLAKQAEAQGGKAPPTPANPAQMRAGPTREREAALLAAWKSRPGA
jgi:2'-hydroxyisoflavone reductase